jgi:RNA 2',3'-cyclic 3'-phosphodiesterase
MPRLFTAVEIPRHIASHLAMLKGMLVGARWVDTENYHLTLRFVGDIDDVAANSLVSTLGEIHFDAFQLSFCGLGSFGGNKPRVVWAGLRSSEPLVRLQKMHERAARLAGLEPETRNYSPHVTLARLQDTRAQAVAEYLSYFGGFMTEPFEISRFVLFSARANHGGGPYVIEETYPLAGASGREVGVA